MELEDVYENVEDYDIKDTRGPQVSRDSQDEGQDQTRRGRVCLVWMTVSLGVICVLLLVFIIRMNIIITAEREEHETTVQEFNHTINRLQTNYTDLRTERDQLQKSFNHLNQKNQECETRVKDLSAEKQQLQQRFESLNQKNQELETELKKLTEQGIHLKVFRLFMSTEAKSWSEIRQFCRDHGGDLVMIKTEEKQRFVSSFVKEFVWIGLSDIQTERSMRWVNDSPLNQGFWERNEPNDSGGNEDCVELNPHKSVLNNWNDVPCSAMRKSLCEH